jgi:hypothetical protein
LTVRVPAGFFPAGFFLAAAFLAGFFLAAVFLAVVLLAGFPALVRAFRRVRRGFLAFGLDAFRFLPVRLLLVVLARFTRLAFARFFFIAPVLPPLACVSSRHGEPYRRYAEVVKALIGVLASSGALGDHR